MTYQQLIDHKPVFEPTFTIITDADYMPLPTYPVDDNSPIEEYLLNMVIAEKNNANS